MHQFIRKYAAGPLWFLLGLFVGGAPLPANDIDVPPGWNRRPVTDRLVLIPPDVPASARFEVQVFPARPLKREAIEKWVDDQLEAGFAGLSLRAKNPLQQQNERMTTAAREYRDPRGQPIIAVCNALIPNPERAQLVCVLSSPNRELTQRYTPAVGRMIATILQGPDQRPLSLPEPAINPRKSGGSAGGPLVYGSYACVLPLKAINSENRYTLTIYDNGEWRTSIDGKEQKTGRYEYNSRTGKIDIDVLLKLYNSRYGDGASNVFLKHADGTASIIGEDDNGSGMQRTTCRYFAPVSDLTPSVAKRQQAEEKAERARYKHVTEPGKGLGTSQIEAIVHHGTGQYQVTGYRFVEKTALLLKDGTVYFGVPCAPADLDVTASRQHDRESWGVWRRNGSAIETRRKDAEPWKPLTGNAVTPAAPAEKVQARYSTRSGYNFGGSGSTFYSAFTFHANGRFEKNNSSLHSSSQASNTATGASVFASGDNSGSVVGAAGPGIAVSSQTEKKDRGDTSGTYTFDGFTLELRYGDGRVVRVPAFYWDATRKNLWIAGTTYSRE